MFGGVTEGLDVVEHIQKAETDDFDRPIEDIRIRRATITKDIPKAPVAKPAPKAPTTKGRKK